MNKDPHSNVQLQTHRSDNAGQDVPLHERLPLEIFYTILHLCVGSTTPVRDLVTLQLVCRSWHDIIAGASFLWGTINATEGLPAVRKALQMAKASLIDLDFTEASSEIDQAEFFKLAREKINQWRSFVVESRQWESALADLQSEKPSNLDTLHLVEHSFVQQGNEEIVLFGGDSAPGLQDVRFVNVPINRASLQLSGLKSLRLERMSSVSAAEVITLLTESPGLEVLHLVGLESAVLPTHTHPSRPNLASNLPIKLAFLMELDLSYLNLTFLSHLLSNVAFPRLCTLGLWCEIDESPAHHLGATLGLNHLNPSINSIASGAEAYKVTLSSCGYYAIIIGGLDIDISFSGALFIDHFFETFTWLRATWNSLCTISHFTSMSKTATRSLHIWNGSPVTQTSPC